LTNPLVEAKEWREKAKKTEEMGLRLRDHPLLYSWFAFLPVGPVGFGRKKQN
jgi:hypothetical protein